MADKVIAVAIIETDVFGAKAYHCRCLDCGWTSKRYDAESRAVHFARRHNCKSGVVVGREIHKTDN